MREDWISFKSFNVHTKVKNRKNGKSKKIEKSKKSKRHV
jgi:hypothetical protein